MNTLLKARLLAAALLCLCAPVTQAQEPPAPATTAPETAPAPVAEPVPEPEAPAESAPAATAPDAAATPPASAPEAPQESAVPAVEADASPAAQPVAAPAPRTGAKRIVVLPVEFTVYQKSVAGVEAVPDWTETAQFALGDAAMQMLQQDSRFQIVNLPQIDGEPAALLREHIELFKIVASTVTGVVQYGKVWADKRTTNFDYSIGDGLTFLADAADADYAFLVTGAQIKQTGGSIFMQVLAAAGGVALPGGGTYVMGGIVDLRTGEVRWINARMGGEVFGITGTDVRDPGTALEIVARMFEGFPASKYATFRAF